MKFFNPTAVNRIRSVQAWQILVGAAMNRQTVTYKGLSQIMYGRDAAGVLDRILGHIAFYCIDNKLPALTSIVVNKSKGIPGDQIPMDLTKRDKVREKVYANDWYNIYPPTAEEFHASYVLHTKK